MSNPFDPGYFTSAELRAFGFRSVGDNVRIARNCTIFQPESIAIGDNSRIDGFCNIIANGPLEIGRHVHIHSYCQIGARGGVTLEDFAALASACLVFSASDGPSGHFMVGGCVPPRCARPIVAPVRLGRHTAAFARVTILPGVTMEEGAVACAHALVTRDVPAWTIVAGAPAEHRLRRKQRLLSLEALIGEIEPAPAHLQSLVSEEPTPLRS